MSLLTNLISYWRLDGNSTDSVGSNNGTDTNITYSAGNGKIVQGAGFNGTTSKIVGSTITVPTNATISCWFKTSQTPSGNYPEIFGFSHLNESPYSIFAITGVDATGHIRAVLIDSNVTVAQVETSSNYNDGNFHFAVAVKTGGKVELFIDYVSKGTDTKTFTGNFDNSSMIMGDYGVGIDYYSGAIDECAYWSRALTQNEIQILYNGGRGLQYPFYQGNMFLLF